MWTRPTSVNYPETWATFTRTNKDGKVINFQIQDVTEDLYSSCIEFMTKHFLPEEPLFSILGILKDPISIQEQLEWWKDILPDKLSLVCLVRDDESSNGKPRIAGVSFLYYHHKVHDETNTESKGTALNIMWNVVKHLDSQTNKYDVLNIEDYIDEFGLCVHPTYRGMGIATEMLKASGQLAKAVGLRATLIIFSAIASQKAAKKIGYKNLVEMKYSDIQAMYPQYKWQVKDTPSIIYAYKLSQEN